jgi:alpha-1,6-mannosyltransferase
MGPPTPMRMADVCAFYTPTGGGVRTYIDQKLRAAPALGHEMIVVAPGARDEVVHRGPGAVLVSIASPTLPFDARYRYFSDEARLHAELDRWRPEHVDASSPWSSATMVGRWQGSGTRALMLHSDPLASYAYRWLGGVLPQHAIDRICGRFWRHLRSLSGVFDAIVTPSRHYAERLAAGGVGSARAVPLGVEPGRFDPRLRDENLRGRFLSELGLPASAALLVAVGRLSPEKRWKMVFRAVAEANASRPVGLLVAGSGPQEPMLQRLCRSHTNIQLLGHVTERGEIARLLASCDALVHGCESETFGLALSEARASGIPLIVPDCGAVTEQLFDGAGLTYRAASRHELAGAILTFVEGGPELQRARATRQSAVRTLDDHFAELFAYYGTIGRRSKLRTVEKDEIDFIDVPPAGHEGARISSGWQLCLSRSSSK